ncbi:hypothetical protein GPROT1_00552 [Gammaproteobacteria bacterium]|nr:hypothetical protein GPROT1_00552 [Gammaproteobacteria bacterium]
MTFPHRVAAALTVAALAACARGGSDEKPVAADAPPIVALATIESPAGIASGEPNLAVDGEGRVYLSWLEPAPDSNVALRLAVRDSTGWWPTQNLLARNDLFVNWADFPSVYVGRSGRVIVHWLQRRPGGRYSYDVMIKQSDDGRAWSEPRLLHDDGVAAEHGFVSFFDAGTDSIEAVWLDGRATGGGEHEGSHGGSMQLANSRIGPDGGVSPNQMIDGRICDCCQTSAAMTAQGPAVVYRDRSTEEIRDISILRRLNGTWTMPARVHADDWHIEGCPVNGPSIAADSNLVAVAWFTGARDTAKVNVAFSTDAGATFAAPIRVDDGNPVGRVDVELDGDGRAIVTWLERAGGEVAEVRMRAVAQGGVMSKAMVIASSAAARASGFPRMVRTGRDLVLAWTQPGDSGGIRIATGRLAAGR